MPRAAPSVDKGTPGVGRTGRSKHHMGPKDGLSRRSAGWVFPNRRTPVIHGGLGRPGSTRATASMAGRGFLMEQNSGRPPVGQTGVTLTRRTQRTSSRRLPAFGRSFPGTTGRAPPDTSRLIRDHAFRGASPEPPAPPWTSRQVPGEARPRTTPWPRPDRPPGGRSGAGPFPGSCGPCRPPGYLCTSDAEPVSEPGAAAVITAAAGRPPATDHRRSGSSCCWPGTPADRRSGR